MDLFTLLTVFGLLLLNSLWIIGLYNSCDYESKEEIYINPADTTQNYTKKVFISKQLLWWVKYYTRHWPWWITKPLYSCCSCMASIHGTLFIVLFMPFTVETLIIAPFYVGALAGLNQLVANKFL